MFKRIASVLLALMLIFTAAQAAFAAPAPTAAVPATAIGFDTTTALGWESFSYVGFHIWEIGGEPFSDWGGKSERGVNAGDGVWTFDFEAKGVTLDSSKQYAVIFYNDKKQQTYNLLFDTTCLGDYAWCDTSQVFENPVDSAQTAYPTYWKNQDPTVNGPELKISSIGNVVGECCARNTTPAKMLEEFLRDTLPNAREFSDLSDQTIIDNIGEGLGLSAAEVAAIIASSGVQVDWSAENSSLPNGSASTEPTQPDDPVPGEATRVEYTVSVPEGGGTATGDKPYLSINYSVSPEYQYDTVTLTATADKGWQFDRWEITGEFELESGFAYTDATITVKAFGSISAAAYFAPAKPSLRGDADGDGEITILDATRIQRFVAELIGADGLDMDAADADGDGEVTILDATRIQRFVAELCDMDGNPLNAEPEQPTEAPTEGPTEALPQIPTEEYELPLV